MYVNKCTKCGSEFETKNPKRVICPNCLYPDKKMSDLGSGSNGQQNGQQDGQQGGQSGSQGGQQEAQSNSQADAHQENQEAKTHYNSYTSEASTPQHPNSFSYGGGNNYNQGGYNNQNYNQQGGYNRPQQGGYSQGGYNRPQQGGYNQGGGYNRPQQSGYNQGGYNRPQQGNRPSYNRPQQGGYSQGGYNRPQQGGYNQGGYNRPQQGGYNQGGYNRPPQQGGRPSYNNRRPQGYGQQRPQGGSYSRGGGFSRGPRAPRVQKPLLITREQLEQIELMYKAMLPLPNPDAHEVIGTKLEIEPRKVFFGINLVRQKMMLPKLPFPKRKLAISPDQMTAIQSLYEPLLPLPPIGCHKIIAAQLKMDEWRVHVGIGLVRAKLGMDRWNQDRPDVPEEFKNQKATEGEEKTSENLIEVEADKTKEETSEVKPKKRATKAKKTKEEKIKEDTLVEDSVEAKVEEAPVKPKRTRKTKTAEKVEE